MTLPLQGGPGWKLTGSTSVPLTKEFANEFSVMEATALERELNKARIAHLKAKHDAGLLVSFNWARAIIKNKAKLKGQTANWLRINGQHSSYMLASLNGGFPEGLFVHLDEFEIESEEAAALLFRQYDDRKSSRSPADVAGVYQMLYEDLRQVPKPIAKLAIEGVAWQNRYVEGIPSPTEDDRYAMFSDTELHDFILWCGGVYSSKTPEFKRVPVVAAMYTTYAKNKDEADKFWHIVARGGDELDESAPTTLLDNFLKIPTDKSKRRDLKTGQYYQGCIHAWNAYREQKPIASIKFDTKKGFLKASE